MYERLGIFEQRRRTLSSFFDLAQHLCFLDPSLRSVMLGCAQYWNDEATDAVQEAIWTSQALVPIAGDRGGVDYALRRDFDWNANTTGVWAFGAMCNEEGYVDDRGIVDPELVNIYLHHDSPVMLVQRVDDELHASWLGAPLRGWLDFPASWTERDYGGNNGLPLLVPDPPPVEIRDDERELYEQALVDRGARDVLRDVWIQRGDPRGELTVAVDAGDLARAGELIAVHGRAWLGSLQAVIPLSGARFGRGPFVEEAYIYADQPTLERVADAPEWGSIETLTFARGSYRALTPRMKHVRAIGPLLPSELAPVDLDWALRDLDVELGDAPIEPLASLAVPLEVLRLRTGAGGVRLAGLPSSIQRVEIWLPGVAMGQPPAANLVSAAFELAIRDLPAGATLAVGVLDSGRRTGWTLVGDATTRRLELVHPDARVDLGARLAGETGLPLQPGVITQSGARWLELGLGMPAVRRLPRR